MIRAPYDAVILRGDMAAATDVRVAAERLAELEVEAAVRAMAAGKPFAGFRS